MKLWPCIFILMISCCLSPLYASDQTATIFFRDAKNYLENITKAQNSKLDEQLEIWTNFLVQYPDTFFKQEIEYNLAQLENVLGMQQKTSQALSGTAVFLKAQKFIVKHKLSTSDQILLWKQFLAEHPNNDHVTEINGLISELQFSLQKKQP